MITMELSIELVVRPRLGGHRWTVGDRCAAQSARGKSVGKKKQKSISFNLEEKEEKAKASICWAQRDFSKG
jgi:hypothetical protein